MDDEIASSEGCMSGDIVFAMITDLIKVAQDVKLPLDRYKTVHNLFILKEPNNYNIQLIRALHKIDAEFNLVRRKIITRRLLRQVERENFLDEDSYG